MQHSYEEVKRSVELTEKFGKLFFDKFNYYPCVSCNFEEEFKMLNMKKEDSGGYRLKEMYDGLPLSGGRYAFNSSLRKQDAIWLLKNHKLGVELFAEIPKK